MTKKDFKVIAASIHDMAEEFRGSPHYERVVKGAQEFAERLAINNARFDRTKFLWACGVLP